MSDVNEERRRNVESRVHLRVETGDSDRDVQFTEKLYDALCRLPEDARALVLDRCFFLAIGPDVAGFYVCPKWLEAKKHEAGESTSRLLIALNAGMGLGDFESQVAHEIAHIWLKHPETDIGPNLGNENAAAALVREWGFEGMGSLSFEERP